MNRRGWLSAMLVLTLGASATARDLPGANLIPNPSFESEGEGDRTNPPGWIRWAEPGGAARYTWDNSSGRKFLRHASTYALKVEDAGVRAGWMTDRRIPIREDRQYVFAGFVSTIRSAGEVRFSLRFSGAGGVLGETLTPAVSASTGAGAGDWVAVSVRVRPPAGATHVQVLCRGDHLVGAAWFEDVRLKELPAVQSGVRELSGGAWAALSAILREKRSRRSGRGVRGAARFAHEFRLREIAVAETIAGMRARGKFWQAAEVARAQAAMWLGVGRQDLDAGWPRRAWEHFTLGAEALKRAGKLSRSGGRRRDPLPAVRTGDSGLQAVDGRGVVFPLGVTLPLRYPIDLEDLDRRLAALARFGLTDVMLDFPWGLWEPEQGKYDFGLIDAMLEAADRHGIRLFPVSGPKYSGIGGRVTDAGMSLMGYTPWYVERYPESALQSASGEFVQDCDGMFREFAFVHPRRLAAVPGYLKAWKTSLTALVRHVRQWREAGQRGAVLGGWLLSSQPRLGSGPNRLRNLTQPGLLGHNPVYITAFRHWLKERYGSSVRLKAAWGAEAPVSFDRADPPGVSHINTAKRDPGARYAGSQRRIADWLKFRARALAEGQAWQQEVMTGLDPGLAAAPLLAEFSMAGTIDPDGLAPDVVSSAVPGPVALVLKADAAPLPLLTHAQDVALALAGALRSHAVRPIWLADYAFRYGGVLSREDRRDLLPAPYVAPYVFSAVLSGARGFFFSSWVSQTGPASLAYPRRPGTLPVTLSDEGVEVARVVALLRVMAPWLARAQPAKPRYGLLVSWETALFEDPEGHHPLAMLHALSLAGVHDVSVVTEDHLLNAPALPYEVLFAPHVTRLAPSAVDALVGYVRNGGLLIADSYLASVGPDGARQRPLAGELAEIFGVTLEMTGTVYSDARTIGAMPTAAFTELDPPVPINLSLFAGGYRVRPGPGTLVLANYTGGQPGREAPAIAVHRYGRGRAVLVPRIRLTPWYLEPMRGMSIFRPELRALRLGRSSPDLNGVLLALTLRSLLARLEVLPAARLIRAPVSETFLAQQEHLARIAGLTAGEIRHSSGIVRATQSGLPYLRRHEFETLAGVFGADLDAFAPVRVSMLEGAEGGRLVAAVNCSSWGREAVLAIPGADLVVDLVTGEPMQVDKNRAKISLAPYQARLLALF